MYSTVYSVISYAKHSSILMQCVLLQLLDEFDEELDGTTTRLAAAQKKVQAVLDRAGSKGQLAIIGFLIVLLVLLVVLAIS